MNKIFFRYRPILCVSLPKRYANLPLVQGIALNLGLYDFAALMVWYNLCTWHFARQDTTVTYRSPPEDDVEQLTSTLQGTGT